MDTFSRRTVLLTYALLTRIGLRVQAAGMSKWTMGLIMVYSGALLYLVSGAGILQVALVAYGLLVDRTTLRWARACEKNEPPDATTGVLPAEYVACIEIAFRGVAFTVGSFMGLCVWALLLAVMLLGHPPPAVAPPPPVLVYVLKLVSPVQLPAGFNLLAIPAAVMYHAGFLAFLIPTTPQEKRFSFAKWLDARRAAATTPVRLRVPR